MDCCVIQAEQGTDYKVILREQKRTEKEMQRKMLAQQGTRQN